MGPSPEVLVGDTEYLGLAQLRPVLGYCFVSGGAAIYFESRWNKSIMMSYLFEENICWSDIHFGNAGSKFINAGHVLK